MSKTESIADTLPPITACPNCSNNWFLALYNGTREGELAGDGTLHLSPINQELVVIVCDQCHRSFEASHFKQILWQ